MIDYMDNELFREWRRALGTTDDEVALLATDSVLWLDGPDGSSVGYDFEATSSVYDVAALYAVKILLVADLVFIDRVWIGAFRRIERAWASVYALRAFRDMAGLERVMNHIEAWMQSEGTLDMEAASLVFFNDQTVPDPFQTLLARGLPYVDPLGTRLSTRISVRSTTDDRQPLYAFEQRRAADGSVSVFASKYWEHGSQFHELAVFMNTDREAWAVRGSDLAWRSAYSLIAQLEDVRTRNGLEAAQHMAESTALGNGLVEADRVDARWFSEGPEDPFLSLQQLRIAREGRIDDNSLRFVFRRGEVRGRDGRPRFALEALKYWEFDQYSWSVIVCTRETAEEIDALVAALQVMPLVEAVVCCERWAIHDQRLREGNRLWRIGPSPRIEHLQYMQL